MSDRYTGTLSFGDLSRSRRSRLFILLFRNDHLALFLTFCPPHPPDRARNVCNPEVATQNSPEDSGPRARGPVETPVDLTPGLVEVLPLRRNEINNRLHLFSFNSFSVPTLKEIRKGSVN